MNYEFTDAEDIVLAECLSFLGDVGIPDHMGSIVVEYQPKRSHMDLIRTNFHDCVRNLAF